MITGSIYDAILYERYLEETGHLIKDSRLCDECGNEFDGSDCLDPACRLCDECYAVKCAEEEALSEESK